jgi:thioredoxin reductase (NADPH)
MMNMQQQAERFGTQTRFGSVVQSVDLSARPFKVTIDQEVVEARCVIIATGAGHRHLGIPSEKALDTKGVTYCATCDGALPMFRNQPLFVIGGGDSACEEALYLTRFASQVYLVHRRDELRASKIMADRVLGHEKIQPIWDTTVEEILGEEVGKVTGIRLKNLKSGEVTEMAAAGVFVAIGLVPNTQLFQGVIDMDEAGYIVPTHGAHTNVEGVFVAGDCADKHYRQAITAAAMGCMAGIDAERYLAG